MSHMPSSMLLTHEGVTRSVGDWASHLGLSYAALRLRLQRHPPAVALQRFILRSPRNGAAPEIRVACTKCGTEFDRNAEQIRRRTLKCIACEKAYSREWHAKTKERRGGWHKGVKYSTSPKALARMFHHYVKLAETFEASVVRGKYGECWKWERKKDQHGYGYLHFRGAMVRAHRVSWMLAFGNWPDLDLLVCHGCDNPECTNPDHLFLGTAKDNADDAIRKGRYRFQKLARAKDAAAGVVA